jgi:hypothetical protein
MLWLSMLVLLVAMVGFTLLFRWTVTRVGGVLGKATYERHSAAEEIVGSGRVPASWRGREEPPYSQEAAGSFLRRLDQLIRSFERAPVFDSEETRKMLLEDLRAARARWARGEWEETRQAAVEPSSPS